LASAKHCVAVRAALGILLGLTSIYLAFEVYVFSLPPLDLARASKLSTLVLSEDHQVLKGYLAEDEVWRLRTTPQDVPQHYLSMLLAYEDHRFFSHHGVDVLAVLRASYLFLRHGRIVSGASTLTMQTVRLLNGQQPGILGKLRQLHLHLSSSDNSIRTEYCRFI
jgi:penicillin-binding protein 1C